MTIRAVIFDLGHTLWDIGPHNAALERAYAGMHATLVRRLRRDGLPEPAAFQAAVRDALFAASETYFTTSTRTDQPPSWTWVDEGCRALGLTLDRDLLREITPPLFATEVDALICSEGTREGVEALVAAGYSVGCVTNTLADGATICQMLRNHGMEQLMGAVVVSADEGYRKPHAMLFEKAMRHLHALPGESVFVGDSPLHDIAGAKAAGMYAVLTRQYAVRPYEGCEPQPDAVIDHVRDLPGVIARFDAKR